MPTNSRLVHLLFSTSLFVLIGVFHACKTDSAQHPIPDIEGLASAFNKAESDLLQTWYPRVVDRQYGGYLSDFNANWVPDGPQRKMIVSQARHVWTASQAALRHPADSIYLEIARHGFHFLKNKMWDNDAGGFFTLVSREGEYVNTGSNALKTAYGNAFGIYGLAAFAKASQDPDALDFAKEAFLWLDDHSHDAQYGGYFQFLTRDGMPLKDGFQGTPPKDQNSSIHLLEAFTALYHVWPDARLHSRLEEMLILIRDTMVFDQKYLQLYFQQDWQPLSYRDSSSAVREANYSMDHVSVGHDIETAFLMLEAARALGLPEEETKTVGKSMVDHALQVGWDSAAGGFYDYVYYLPGESTASVIKDTKTWWAQAEGLNALLLMHTLYPDDGVDYFEHFELLWRFTNDHLIDHERGGWYSGGLDKEPERRDMAKSHIWKGSYHTVRSLMHCAEMLEKLR